MRVIDRLARPLRRRDLFKSAAAFAAGWVLTRLLRMAPPRAAGRGTSPRIAEPPDSVKRHG